MQTRQQVLFDILLFAAALAVALWNRDTGHNVVWGMWLSSLVLGYAYIVWSIGRWVFALKGGAFVGGVFSGVFLLGFFTFHFGMFHFGHAIFLNDFFPIPVSGERTGLFLSFDHYWWVISHYWWFLLIALLSERSAFMEPRAPLPKEPGNTAKALRKVNLMKPYAKVVRLHILIFVFAFADTVGLTQALILVIIHAAYFLPWRNLPALLRKPSHPKKGSPSATTP